MGSRNSLNMTNFQLNLNGPEGIRIAWASYGSFLKAWFRPVIFAYQAIEPTVALTFSQLLRVFSPNLPC